MAHKPQSKATKAQTTTPNPGTIYRLTFEQAGISPLYVRVQYDVPTAPIETSLTRRKWTPTRWRTQDMRGNLLRLVMLLINDIDEPRTVATAHEWDSTMRGWLNRTRYLTPEEADKLEREALDEVVVNIFAQ